MNDKELIEYMLKDKESSTVLRVSAILNVLVNAMLQKGWFTEEDFDKAVEEGLEKLAEFVLKSLSKEQREVLETRVRLSKNDLFGTFFK